MDCARIIKPRDKSKYGRDEEEKKDGKKLEGGEKGTIL